MRNPERRIAAVVTTFHPDSEFTGRFDRLNTQVGRIVIVDNGSDEEQARILQGLGKRAGITLVMNGANEGVARALNQGIRVLATEGFEWVLTLDQDTVLLDRSVDAMWRTIEGDENPETLALVGSNRVDARFPEIHHRWLRQASIPPFFERITCDRIDSNGITNVITSGTLVNVVAYNRIGAFRDDYFIDLVDTEYCLRARCSGYRILVSCQATILHRIGETRPARILGIRISPMNHPPIRKYYILRNTILTARLYGVKLPHWLIYQSLAIGELVLGVLLFEDRKAAKMRACFQGLWDGIRGRSGKTIRNF